MINPIEGPRSISSTSSLRKKAKVGKAKSSSFSNHLDETEETHGAAAADMLGPVSGIFNLQEVDDALSGAAKGKLRAEDILDKLDDLRLDLLTGSVSKTKLLRLSQIVNEKKVLIDDSRLNEILEEIDLRAQVELAKFMRT